MIYRLIFVVCCFFICISFNCKPSNNSQSTNTLYSAENHVFYLHGKILEDYPIDSAISPVFGEYEYTNILQRINEGNTILHSEKRNTNTNITKYGQKIILQIDTLVSQGNNPDKITVIGASKGAAIAMSISSSIKNSKINYVLLGNCVDDSYDQYSDKLSGNILLITEDTDTIGGSDCERFLNSPNIRKSKHIRLNTGLGHGFLYKPLDEWIKPAINW